jgi:hypothetical protein
MKNIETAMGLVAHTAERWFVAVIENDEYIKKHILSVVDALDTQVCGKGSMNDEENTLISGAAILCNEKSINSDFYSKRLLSLFHKNNEAKAVALHRIMTEFAICIEKSMRSTIAYIAKQSNKVLPEKETFDESMKIFISEIDESRHTEAASMLMLALVPNIKKAVREANFIASLLG